MLRTLLCAAGAALPLLGGLAAKAAETDSAVYVELRSEGAGSEAASERWKLYGASHALVIGIDDYANGWPRLSNAVKDAEAVAAGLESQGFNVELLRNPGSGELRTALRAFFARKGADPEARLFLWYAGHGHTDYGEGYLVPADAPLPEDPEFLFQALHLGDIGSMVRIARSKHVFAVFDSCFAGTIFNASRARPPAAVTRAVAEPVRQFLTSGDADQEVSDDGTFRDLFLRALSGDEDADANGDGYLTGTELSLYLEDRVINLTNSLQTPRSGKLRDRRFDQGDFIFVLPQAEEEVMVAAAAPAESAEAAGTRALPAIDRNLAVELAFWDAIKASESVADYQAYLTAYPEGQFAPLAQARIAELEARVARLEAEQERLEEEARLQREEEERRRAEEEARRQAEEEARRQREAEREAQLAALTQQQPEADPAEEAELALNLNRNDRKELQAALTALGFDTKGVDGFFGPGTRAAIKGYQATKGAEQTGFLTASLASELIAEAPKPEPPPQPVQQAAAQPAAQPAQTQTAALPPAVGKGEVESYVSGNGSTVTEQFFRYNNQWRLLILPGDSRPPNKIELGGFRVKEIVGDEILASVMLKEARGLGRSASFYTPATKTVDFLLKWTGNGLEIVGHKEGYEIRRTGG